MSRALDSQPTTPDAEHGCLHEQTAARIRCLIEDGAFRAGDRIPSVRQLSRDLRVSINTVLAAYAHLEDLGLVRARPHAGYYVCGRIEQPSSAPSTAAARRAIEARAVAFADPALRRMSRITDPRLVPLGRSILNTELSPIDKLNRMLSQQGRRMRMDSAAYSPSNGLVQLRREVARRLVQSGCTVSPDEVVITSGCMEAINLALRVLCRPGDTVAIASPVFYTFLCSMQWAGLSVLEIPSTPSDGIDLEALEYAVRHHPVRACVIISNYGNPLGSVLSDEKKRELVSLLAKHQVPLIEDDIYGDLGFDGERPPAAKAFDRDGNVLLCASCSKTVAPGYRVGWIVPGRYREELVRAKAVFNVAAPSPTQLALADYLAHGGYDRHLRSLRRTHHRQVMELRDAVARTFPAGTRVTRPRGGFVVWVEMPEEVDADVLFEESVRVGISVAPGSLFSVHGRYRNCMRLSAAEWSPRIEHAVETVGQLASQLVEKVRGGAAPR